MRLSLIYNKSNKRFEVKIPKEVDTSTSHFFFISKKEEESNLSPDQKWSNRLDAGHDYQIKDQVFSSSRTEFEDYDLLIVSPSQPKEILCSHCQTKIIESNFCGNCGSKLA